LGYFVVNKGKTVPPIKFQDINANFAGIQVNDIKSAYARANANGAITVSEGGIIDFHKGRAAMIRDSDVGGYIMLWQPAK
jgi:predicted enzyme related to lactoylglutathione lyase